jgi:ATP-binding cassette subfamily B protein
LLGSVITSALDLCFPLFMRYILGDVLPEGNLFLLGQATIVLLFLYLINFIISYQVSRHGRLMGAKIEQDMRSDLFQHVQSMSFRYFDNIRIGQLFPVLSAILPRSVSLFFLVLITCWSVL